VETDQRGSILAPLVRVRVRVRVMVRVRVRVRVRVSLTLTSKFLQSEHLHDSLHRMPAWA